MNSAYAIQQPPTSDRARTRMVRVRTTSTCSSDLKAFHPPPMSLCSRLLVTLMYDFATAVFGHNRRMGLLATHCGCDTAMGHDRSSWAERSRHARSTGHACTAQSEICKETRITCLHYMPDTHYMPNTASDQAGTDWQQVLLKAPARPHALHAGVMTMPLTHLWYVRVIWDRDNDSIAITTFT